MIVNLSCPKCGGPASEYDEKKWQCLKCGDKFLYEPTQPNQTFVQNNVNIQGQVNFELDVANAKQPIPVKVKMVDYESIKSKWREVLYGDLGKGTMALLELLPPKQVIITVWREALIGNGTIKKALLELLPKQEITVGYNTICPHCEAVFVCVKAGSPYPLEGIKHCLGCGKQFYTTNGVCYPVKFT